jgi:hypothetical protein
MVNGPWSVATLAMDDRCTVATLAMDDRRWTIDERPWTLDMDYFGSSSTL